MTDAISRMQILPNTTVEQIGEMCRAFSDNDTEVVCRVEHVNGRAVAFLVRTPREQALPMFLRKQA
jgi:hypothetical protein